MGNSCRLFAYICFLSTISHNIYPSDNEYPAQKNNSFALKITEPVVVHSAQSVSSQGVTSPDLSPGSSSPTTATTEYVSLLKENLSKIPEISRKESVEHFLGSPANLDNQAVHYPSADADEDDQTKLKRKKRKKKQKANGTCNDEAAHASPLLGPMPIGAATPHKRSTSTDRSDVSSSTTTQPNSNSITPRPNHRGGAESYPSDSAPNTTQILPRRPDIDDIPILELPPAATQGSAQYFETIQSDGMMSILAAVAHEAYGSKTNSKDRMSPKNWLEANNFKFEKYASYIVVSSDVTDNKDVFIAFPGTNLGNLTVSIGSCTEWDDDQFDRTGNAMLPGIVSFIKKPYTYLRNAAFSLSLYYFTSMFYLWSQEKDILYSGSAGVMFMSLASLMYLNLIPAVASKLYVKHLINLYHEIEPIYKEHIARGHNVYFVGHSLGGHIAEIMAHFFPQSTAVSFSAPGGGCSKSLSIAGRLIAQYGKELSCDIENWKKRIVRIVMEGDPIHNVLKHKFDNDGIYTIRLPSNTNTHSEEESNQIDKNDTYDMSAHRIYEIYLTYMFAHAKNNPPITKKTTSQ
ncbi:MAG: hypothetical protein KBD31_01485 [Proteobacteria bacterium]|nr:hypothetical protein [Pseudomonadota bacterium]